MLSASRFVLHEASLNDSQLKRIHSTRDFLQDFMHSEGFPLHLRDRTPVICIENEVIAVYPKYRSSKVIPKPGGQQMTPALVDADKSVLTIRIVVDSVS